MGAIDQLQSASLVSQALCRQALAEARADPSKMPALQQAFDTKQEQHFEKPEQYDQLLQFIQEWQSDKFELRPNTDNRLPRRPTVTEARITKVEEQKRLVEMNPPAPPVNPGRYRDPLHITGVAEPGCKVEVYNASQPGRPVIASTTADATGKYRIELTDETKFIFGDQMGVVARDGAGQKSRALIVPTEPFMVTNLTTEYVQRRGMPVVRTDVTSSMRALDVNHDERDPFYQDQLVKKVASEPRAVGEPWTMEIKGGDDAVEPNSTISVQVGSETFTTKAADDGTFALKLSGFTPGQRLKLEIRDVNGKGVDQPLQAPHVAFEQNRVAAGVTVAPTFTAPTGMRETIGTDAPFIAIKASEVTVPFGAVVVKNETTGQVFELAADDKGSISAALGGVGEFDVLQVATRDANGNFSESTTRMVVLPEKQAYGQLMMPVEQLGPKNIHHLKKVLEAIEGPPHDLFTKKNGVDIKDPRGPFVGLPAIKGLPPFGQLAIVRDGEVTQTLRADKDGVLKGFLRGVNVGDRLDVRVLDAAGRRFGDGVVGYEVPGTKIKTKLADENFHTPSDARALKDLVELVGSGTLDVEHAWVQPFTVGAQANPPADTNSFKLHYAPLVFSSTVGQPVAVPDAVPQQLIEQLPDGLAAKFATATTDAAHMKAISIGVSDNAGTQRLTINNGRGTICSVGVDYAVGSVNAGSFSQPLTAAHLPQLAEGLRTSLALVAAAYDQGKEPGDLVYDRAMSAAKTILYALDRFAVANPTSRTDARAAAVEGVPKDFNFELFAKDLIPPQAQTTPLASVTGKRTSTMSLIEARQASLGRVEVKVPTTTSGPTPPRVDQAAILRAGQQGHGSPIVVRGRGAPGEIVQVFNVSVGARQLVGESIVGPDGRFEMIASGAGAVGDQLGVVAASKDGKERSRMSIVPTDAYLYNGKNLDSAKPWVGATDERPPMVMASQLSLKNASWDDKGNVRAGAPLWTLNAADFAVEPGAVVSVTGKKPDGTLVKVSARADDEGRLSLEFPFPARSTFSVDVVDLGGQSARVQLTTGGLADTAAVQGDRLAEAASGRVTLRVGNAEIKGVVIANSLANNTDLKLDINDRTDGFVDVLLQQSFSVQQTNGVSSRDVQYRVKIPADEAKKFAAGINDQIQFEGAVLDAVRFGQDEFISARPNGPAKILDRDYVVSDKLN